MARTGITLVALTAIAATGATEARAEVLVLYGDLHGGGMYGKGLSGDQKETAFFQNAPAGMYGARVAARFLFLGAAIQHHQYTNGSQVSTWTQFSAGLDFQVGLGTDKQKKERKGTFFELGANLGFGVGTGQQVMPPLSNDEITDKAFLLEGRLGYGKHLNKLFDVGITVPVSWGYFFKNGVDASANDVSTHYRGLQVEGLLFLRANIRLL
ncbi:MAG: hypothetical protein KIT31_41975 [Deltaproteobacteria bacterium]|nr:hypothetical protein [Deltaproteobacteria bacterium]